MSDEFLISGCALRLDKTTTNKIFLHHFPKRLGITVVSLFLYRPFQMNIHFQSASIFQPCSCSLNAKLPCI